MKPGIVRFKSHPRYYKKEKDGLKSNTLRKVDEGDIRFQALRRNSCGFIEIINSTTNESFMREITDYTEYEGWAIISWRGN
jgi:hypothetical protein